MPTKQLPYDYRSARIDRMTQNTDQSSTHVKYCTDFGSFDGPTDTTAELMRCLLPGIELAAQTEHASIQKLVRAEFIWDRTSNLPESRGVVLWDNRGYAILHVVNALLGYNGSGPALSEVIMMLLGVPDDLFDQANDAVSKQNYVIVFSREHHGIFEGVDTAIPYTEPGAWEWWRAR